MQTISIIIPVYNVEELLKRCLDSVLRQTYTVLDIIVLDDGSTDHSKEICDSYAELDSRVRVIHKKNEGISATRDRGISESRGEYIFFVDSDDYIHPETIEILYNLCAQYDADIVQCCFFENDIASNKFKEYGSTKVKLIENIEILTKLNQQGCRIYSVLWNKLYKREIFDNLRFEPGIINEDEYLLTRIYFKCRKFIQTDAILYYYTYNRNNSIMNTVSIKRLDVLQVFEDRIKFFNEKGLNKLSLKASAMLCYEYIYLASLFHSTDKKISDKLIDEFMIRRSDFLKNSELPNLVRLFVYMTYINKKLILLYKFRIK